MGDIADMMLDGIECQVCGAYMDDSTGWPTECASCAMRKMYGQPHEGAALGERWRPGPHLARNWADRQQTTVPAKVKVICPVAGCGRRVKAVGFYQHLKDMHSDED